MSLCSPSHVVSNLYEFEYLGELSNHGIFYNDSGCLEVLRHKPESHGSLFDVGLLREDRIRAHVQVGLCTSLSIPASLCVSDEISSDVSVSICSLTFEAVSVQTVKVNGAGHTPPFIPMACFIHASQAHTSMSNVECDVACHM